MTQTAAVGGRPPLDLLGGKIFCLCSCFLDFVCLFLDTELFQASTPSLGWLVGRSVRLLDFPALALHCIVTDIKDPAKVVAMVKHVVERLQNDFCLFLAIIYISEEYFESKLSNSKCTPLLSVCLRTIKDQCVAESSPVLSGTSKMVTDVFL